MNVATLTGARPASQEAPTTSADLAAIKARQHAAWSSGDYAVVGTTLQIVGEELCEALDLRSGRKVLDVAAGNGMVSLAAARRWCDVSSTDYVASLLERGRARVPQSSGDIAAAGGAMYFPSVLNRWPIKPSGVQFVRPI